jgi:polar amino acid transport system permease protein
MNWEAAVFWQYLLSPAFPQAAWTSVWVAIVAQGIGVLVGLGAALLGVAPNRIARAVAAFYVWLWRGTPLLVQLLILYLGLPQLGIRLSVEQAGLLGLGLNAGAYMAEIVRAGLLSVDSGQSEAARSLGMSSAQSMRLIVLPQAARVVLPPLGNEFNGMLRTTSLLSVISFEELLRVTTVAISTTFRPVELYSAAALYYLAMTTGWNCVQWLIERRLAPRSRASSRPGVPRGPLSGLLGRRPLPSSATFLLS